MIRGLLAVQDQIAQHLGGDAGALAGAGHLAGLEDFEVFLGEPVEFEGAFAIGFAEGPTDELEAPVGDPFA